MHSPRRDGRVLITADQPWEKDCHVLVYSSVVKDRGKIRVWYDLFKRTGSFSSNVSESIRKRPKVTCLSDSTSLNF